MTTSRLIAALLLPCVVAATLARSFIGRALGCDHQHAHRHEVSRGLPTLLYRCASISCWVLGGLALPLAVLAAVIVVDLVRPIYAPATAA